MLAESLKFEKAKENVNRVKTGSQNQVVCDVTLNKQKQRVRKNKTQKVRIYITADCRSNWLENFTSLFECFSRCATSCLKQILPESFGNLNILYLFSYR